MSLPTQQNLNANQSLVTYLQPLGSLGVPNMEQGQVIIGASDMQGNLTLHNVAGLTAAGKRGSSSQCFVLKLLICCGLEIILFGWFLYDGIIER